ncbi:Adenosylcobinamide-phosphate guanylyltransferase [Methanocaldococcus lauensis]|uniref:Adenosylcobinamide-phosphate guanylyltransferase n=1 Tax=Methanocaldococcus lauensis TaxID=2546128 RepID=A0A8D6PVH0_9EURY|nr:adenosylcobinamide-phosphate guanylyltransferase [Methanocaldococcus lauensis]CAB3288734.1 Adenosylcobinamide-phosphate guanylyltransferase [Methanocaldococcus lauensis]
MDALIMAGGKGSRMGYIEKPLIKIKDKPLISYVIQPLLESDKINKIYIATSPNTKTTKKFIISIYKDYKNIKVIETSGNGYIEDLNECIKYFSKPFLVVSSDLINLTSKIINSIVDYFYYVKSKNPEIESLSVMIPKNIYSKYTNPTIDFNGLIPVGINILSPKSGYQKEKIMVIDELIINVNTPEDLKFAENFLKKR